MYAFKGRTVDNVIAAIGANHPNLTTQKSFYVETSRARDRAELVTDDATELRAQLYTTARYSHLAQDSAKASAARVAESLRADMARGGNAVGAT